MRIQSKNVYIAGRFIPIQIEMKEEKITSITEYGLLPCDIDYDNDYIVPGFIDIHTHGAYGCNVNTATEEDFKDWSRKLTQEGVTSFLPTTITDSVDVISSAVTTISNVIEDVPGARIIGIHIEGPFLNSRYKGAQPEEFIIEGNIDLVDKWQQASKNNVKYITLAAELEQNFKILPELKERNIVAALGHTSATYNETAYCIANGVDSLTHTFNAMTPLHHRDPGVVGAAMTFDIYSELIADGIHVDPSVASVLYNQNPNVIMISDSVMYKGLEPGQYNGIEVDELGTARIIESKTLAGSSLKINEGVRKMVIEGQVQLSKVIDSTSLNPAKLLGISHVKGKIKANYDADIVVLDKSFNVVDCYVLGIKK